MATNPTKIKTVYTFVVATIKLDLNTAMDKAIVEQTRAYACQVLRQGSPEFEQLYSQVERENPPQVLGTGKAKSPKDYTDAFSKWLKSNGIDMKDPDRKKKISFQGGNAQNPQDGKSFSWMVFLYFDFGK